MTVARQLQTYSHPNYAAMLTEVYQVVKIVIFVSIGILDGH